MANVKGQATDGALHLSVNGPAAATPTVAAGKDSQPIIFHSSEEGTNEGIPTSVSQNSLADEGSTAGLVSTNFGNPTTNASPSPKATVGANSSPAKAVALNAGSFYTGSGQPSGVQQPGAINPTGSPAAPQHGIRFQNPA